jgi:hypothetical protein
MVQYIRPLWLPSVSPVSDSMLPGFAGQVALKKGIQIK